MTTDETQPQFDAASHYDRVTEAWGLLLGEELHYGVFASPDDSLESATAALTSRMIKGAELKAGQRVLDVGCGSGSQACQLAADHGVEVLGITTSRVGVEHSTARAARNGVEGATFEQRDGTATGLPDESFDRVWVLESSHLMPNRVGLVNECARVLKPGGRMVLCDIIRRREIPFLELRSRADDFAVLRAAFGEARMDPLDDYVAHATDAGLTVHDVEDLTQQTLPTFDRWEENVTRHRDEVTAILGEESVRMFEESCGILRGFWLDGTLGYGFLSASKPA
jgi:27-O-demethylrifamycin SV methyltransferase